MRAWRLIRAGYRQRALEGEGARRNGGRWNSVGTAIGYAASSLELAVLEALVNSQFGSLPVDYLWIEFDVPDDAIGSVGHLPPHWDAPGPHRAEVQAVGDEWIRSKRSLALRVPAAVLPERSNLLVNPAHPRVGEVREIDAAAFTWPRKLLHYVESLASSA